ncbi:MAG: hypothetical protein R2688_02680 [Fimbriimonadaceae bacterium]
MQGEIERQELTNGEVREILERLAMEEFGGSELSTIGDLSEALGVRPLVIGNMLAEIRRTRLDSFVDLIGESARRIDTLEESVTHLKSEMSLQGPAKNRVVLVNSSRRHDHLDRFDQKQVFRTKMFPKDKWVIAASIIGVITILVGFQYAIGLYP